MARCCSQTGTCACKMQDGRQVEITGSGTSQDPFVISSTASLAVEDNAVFDLGLTGNGTLDSPWTLSLGYASTSRLTDLPDVIAPAPTNAQVLQFSTAEGRWVAGPPATATPGAISKDTSLTGDGSASSPLGVRANAARYLRVTASGVELTDAAINRMVRVFPDAATRAATTIVPETTTISVLNTDPGRLDYWDGAEWLPISNGIQLAVQPGELLSLSGTYDGGTVIQYVDPVFSAETGIDGTFEVISADTLSNYAGVLTAQVVPTGDVAWTPMIDTDTDRIVGRAYRVDDGTPYAGFALTGIVTALLY